MANKSVSWNDFHKNLFDYLVLQFNKNNIRYFILRNYEGLPELNSSKDIDIIVDPQSVDLASSLLKEAYRKNGILNYYEIRFGDVRCAYGMNLKTRNAIHIDLIPGYKPKGFEIFSFDELYENTVLYKNFRVLNDLYDGVMLLVYKIFCYKKPVLKNKYRAQIKTAYFANKRSFSNICRILYGEKLAAKILELIELDKFDEIIVSAEKITFNLKIYCLKKNPLFTLTQSTKSTISSLVKLLFRYRVHAKTFAVIGGTPQARQALVNAVSEELRYYYLRDSSLDICRSYGRIPLASDFIRKKGKNKRIASHYSCSRTNIHWFNIFRHFDALIGWNLQVRRDVMGDFYSALFDVDNLYIDISGQNNLSIFEKLSLKAIMRFIPYPEFIFRIKNNSDSGRVQSLEVLRNQDPIINSNKNHTLIDFIDSSDLQLISIHASEMLINRYTESLPILQASMSDQNV